MNISYRTKMSDKIKSLQEVIKKLSPDKQNEVILFAKKLLQKENNISGKKMDLSWAGALKEYKNKYTSLNLQKKALEWWGD